MKLETKSVSKVVLRDNVLSQIEHAELYKTFREILTKKYQKQEKKFFSEQWIAFTCGGKKWYWNSKLELGIISNPKYVYSDNYNELYSEKNIVGLVDSKSNCPDEIMTAVIITADIG